jgi:outer membrane protein assembly factor BamB
VGNGQFVIHTAAGIALVRGAKQADGKYAITQLWESTKLKPSLNDFVVQDGAIYGFDDGIFCCLDLKTGKRLWKAGRYGHGQVLLLADQKLLLIVSETGEVVLVAANSERHEEIARFQAISGKTWNHPIVAHGRLYVRNAEEMACFELSTGEEPRLTAAR